MSHDLKTIRQCALCGEEYSGRGRAKYCSDSCRKKVKMDRNLAYRGYTRRPVKTCEICGEDYLAHFKHQRFCGKHTDTDKNAWVNGFTRRVGDAITCEWCGGLITRDAPNQRFCHEPCAPNSEPMACARCGEVKGKHEYYDHRGRGADKILSTCKECLRSDARDRARRKNK